LAFLFTGENMKKDSNNNSAIKSHYPTKHIFCAAYLLSLGHRINHIDADYGEKSTMYFEGVNVEQDALGFFNATAKKVNPKAYADSYRHIKDLLFQNK